MLVYLVRHGESVANRNNFHHKPDTPLSEDGVKQAKVVATRLKNIDIDFIYSSPQERAKQTAQIISKERGLSIEFWDSLKEIRAPSEVWGKPLDNKDIERIDHASGQSFLKNVRYSDEETFEELNARGLNVLDHLLKKHKGKNILCVSHSTMTKMIVARVLFGDSLNSKIFVNLRKHLWVKNTGITVCEHTEKYGWTLNVWNDTTHL